MKTTFHIITLFPESFSSYLGESILARAQKEKLFSVAFYNPRTFVKPNKSQKGKKKPYLRVDDRPYGGGPGMVMEAMPVIKAIEKALATAKSAKNKKNFKKELIIFLSPSGAQFTNALGTKFAKEYSDIIIICGRYEGIDARIKKIFKMTDISVGPFVTTGGEVPAMLMIDVMARQIPGVLGKFESREESRVASSDVYTRPEALEYKGKKYKVPKVLLSGDHKKIEEWREEKNKRPQ
jgi:tRNA (guanine37-N1)-methyltransferase